MTGNPTALNREKALDGLRAIAVLSVLGVHWLAPYLSHGLFAGGYAGVPLFFVISGYLITRLLDQSTSNPRAAYSSFMCRRARRLMPVFLVFLGVGGIFYVLVPGSNGETQQVVLSALVVSLQVSSIWLALGLGDLYPYEHFWTLGIEWMFYAIWPFVIWKTNSWGYKKKLFLHVSSIVLLYLGSCLFASNKAFYFSPLSAFPFLIAGAICHFVSQEISARAVMLINIMRGLLPFLLVAFLLFVLLGPSELDSKWRSLYWPIMLLISSGIILGVARAKSGFTYWLLTNKLMANLGKRSYSLYVWHYLCINTFTKQTPLSPAMLAVLSIGLTLAFTELSYRYLELPYFKTRVKG